MTRIDHIFHEDNQYYYLPAIDIAHHNILSTWDFI